MWNDLTYTTTATAPPPPLANESTKAYCRRTNSVVIGGNVWQRSYLEWLGKMAQAHESIPRVTTYTLPEPKHWARWIILATAIGTIGAALLLYFG